MRRIGLVLALVLQAVASAAGGEQGRGGEKTPEEVLRSFDQRRPDRLPLPFVALRIGQWNTMLQPWLPYEERVLKVIATTQFDVLALEEVWTEEARDRILALPAVQAKYPYHHWIGAAPQLSRCPFTPAIAGDIDTEITAEDIGVMVTEQAINDYISCLISTGVDTRTVEQPVMPINGLCQFIGLNIALDSQTCFARLTNTMQDLPSGDPGAYGARDLCYAGTGQNLSHQGNVGRLVLSKWPMTEIQDVNFDTFSIRRATTYAKIAGVSFAFVHFPNNPLFDIDPSLGPLQIGSLQLDLANDLVLHKPRVILGGFNSGPDYQPEGYNVLTQNGYRPVLTKTQTYSPAQLQDFAPCGDFDAVPTSVDNILVQQHTAACLKTTFGDNDASDHVGVAALCIVKK